MVICYIFSRFGMLCQEKSGNLRVRVAVPCHQRLLNGVENRRKNRKQRQHKDEKEILMEVLLE
jgi:hypothetical protein